MNNLTNVFVFIMFSLLNFWNKKSPKKIGLRDVIFKLVFEIVLCQASKDRFYCHQSFPVGL